jgi:hypothetical protein
MTLMSTPPDSFDPPDRHGPRRRGPPSRSPPRAGPEREPLGDRFEFQGLDARPHPYAPHERRPVTSSPDRPAANGAEEPDPRASEKDSPPVPSPVNGHGPDHQSPDAKPPWRKIVGWLVGLGVLIGTIVKTSAFTRTFELTHAVVGLTNHPHLLLVVFVVAVALGGFGAWGKREDRRRRRWIRGSVLATLLALIVPMLVAEDSNEGAGLRLVPPPSPLPLVTDPSPNSKGSFEVGVRPNTLTTGPRAAYAVTVANELVELLYEQLVRGGPDVRVRVLRRRLPEGVTQVVRCGEALFVAAHTGWVRGYSMLDGHLVAKRDFFKDEDVGMVCVRRYDQLAPRLFVVRAEPAEVLRLDIGTRLLDRLSKWVPMRPRGYSGPADIDATVSTRGHAEFSDVDRAHVVIASENLLGLGPPYAVGNVPDARTLVPVGSRVVAHQPGRHCGSVIDVAEGDVIHRVAMGSSMSFGGGYRDEAYLVDEGGELTMVDVSDPDSRAKHVQVADAPIDAKVAENGDLIVATDSRVVVFSRAALMKSFASTIEAWPATTACGFPPPWAKDRNGAER